MSVSARSQGWRLHVHATYCKFSKGFFSGQFYLSVSFLCKSAAYFALFYCFWLFILYLPILIYHMPILHSVSFFYSLKMTITGWLPGSVAGCVHCFIVRTLGRTLWIWFYHLWSRLQADNNLFNRPHEWVCKQRNNTGLYANYSPTVWRLRSGIEVQKTEYGKSTSVFTHAEILSCKK